jgi:hypothetical protein
MIIKPKLLVSHLSLAVLGKGRRQGNEEQATILDIIAEYK